ncbi:hypothetical protein RRG08_041171 [Elysia crispata]|uniref:Uncharacterized protein n=1 Tax=Elysia crispata TaxID=231223 RepID=A0AAE0XXP6_9GAST|nr:hypothetical protein RRG08_041171 [Elysia crispata]
MNAFLLAIIPWPDLRQVSPMCEGLIEECGHWLVKPSHNTDRGARKDGALNQVGWGVSRSTTCSSSAAWLCWNGYLLPERRSKLPPSAALWSS